MPSTEPTWVIEDSSLNALAMPKSASFTTPSSPRRRLPGLTSRCTTPLRCAYSRPRQAWATIDSASRDLEQALVAQDLGARLPAHELHDDVLAVGRLVEAEVEDLDDVGVHEPRDGQRLAPEARDELAVVGEVLGQQLDGDVALEARVEGAHDGRHAADAEPLAQLVAAGEDLAGHHGAVLPADVPPVPVSVPVVVVSVAGRAGARRCPSVPVVPVSVVVGLGARRAGVRGRRLGGRRVGRRGVGCGRLRLGLRPGRTSPGPACARLLMPGLQAVAQLGVDRVGQVEQLVLGLGDGALGRRRSRPAR